MLMWERYRLYNRGIAIKTTMGNLKKSLPKSPHMFIGRVNYTEMNEVVTSPYTRNEKWIAETVKSVVHKYGFNFPVSISRLLG